MTQELWKYSVCTSQQSPYYTSLLNQLNQSLVHDILHNICSVNVRRKNWRKTRKKEGRKEEKGRLEGMCHSADGHSGCKFRAWSPEPKCQKGSPCFFVVWRCQKNFTSSVDGPFHLQPQAQEAGDMKVSLESHGSFPVVLQYRTDVMAAAWKNDDQSICIHFWLTVKA